MRQRKIKNLQEKLESFAAYIIRDPKSSKGAAGALFPKKQPLYLEIGCGKGQFITRCAAAHPEWNFLAVEGNESVVLRALEKAAEQKAENIRFILGYVDDLGDLFAPGELSGIFLNFSDPWPKDRHAKRRLTCARRLAEYQTALLPGGFIQFKTDNDDLFDFTLEQIEEAGLYVEALSRDLHHSQLAAENITTEYEDKFAGAGKTINYVRISVKS